MVKFAEFRERARRRQRRERRLCAGVHERYTVPLHVESSADALPSTAKDGTVSRIVPFLGPGGGVVTSRADVHYVVTEYGIADLFGKSLRGRARELISIAHPSFRGTLEKECDRIKWLQGLPSSEAETTHH